MVVDAHTRKGAERPFDRGPAPVEGTPGGGRWLCRESRLPTAKNSNLNLTKNVKALKKLLSDYATILAKISHLKDLEANYTSTLTGLQSTADPDDEAKATAMLTLQGQLALVPRRREILEQNLSAMESGVAAEIDACIPRVNTLLRNKHQALLKKMGALLRDVVITDDEALKVAAQASKIIRAERLAQTWSIGTWCNSPYQKPIEAAQALVQFVKECNLPDDLAETK